MRSYGRSEHPQSLETLLQILHSCRKDQSSRKGRYKFWRSVVDSIEQGFKYVEAMMAESPDTHLLEAHRELRKWVSVNEKKLESLMARDEDHVDRVENVSHMVWSLVISIVLLLLIGRHSFTASLGSGTYGFSPALRELRSGIAKT
jgi:hypothetical protein